MNWQERAEKAEAELARMREQKPLAWGTSGELMDILKNPIYSSPAPVSTVADPRLHPEWKGRNSYGLDMDYFRRKLEQVLRGLDRYTPEEFARAMAVHSRTADESVIASEFVPAVAAPAVPDDRVSQDDAALMQAASALALYRAGESAEYMAKAIEALLQSAPTGEQK